MLDADSIFLLAFDRNDPNARSWHGTIKSEEEEEGRISIASSVVTVDVWELINPVASLSLSSRTRLAAIIEESERMEGRMSGDEKKNDASEMNDMSCVRRHNERARI